MLRVLTAFFLLSCAFALSHLGTEPAFAEISSDAEDAENLDESIPNIEAYFTKLGIGQTFSRAGFVALKNVVAGEYNLYESIPKEDKERASAKKKALPFLEYALELLQIAESNPGRQLGTYVLGKRVLYTVWSEDKSRLPADILLPPTTIARRGLGFLLGIAERLTNHPIRDEMVEKKFRQARQVLADRTNVWVPRPMTAANEAIGNRQAAKEASFLIAPGTTRMMTAEDLAGMSWKRISQLDVSEAHPAWYTRTTAKIIGTTAEARWKHLEKLIEAKLSEDLKTTYTIARGRRVVFFDKVKTSATSAKIDTEDGFGIGWKVKWGDEIQTETITNRLYVGLGGKITDLVYANGPGVEGFDDKADDGLVLILPKENAEKRADAEAKHECFPVTADELAACLKNSSYNFNFKPVLLETGVIDRAYFDRVLAGKLPTHKRSLADWFAKVSGARYVTFRESMMELQPSGAVVRAGAPAVSSSAALEDRVARSLVLFNMWIANRDVKDDNNKAFLLNLPNRGTGYSGVKDSKGRLYLEAQHDMGMALGGLFAAGEVNALAGASFIRECAGGRQICFHEDMLYVPESWKVATYSDLLFMGQKIVGLTHADLLWAVGETNWPRFMVEAMVSKLEERRSGIVQMLGADALDLPLQSGFRPYSKTLTVSAAKIDALAAELRLPAEKLRPLVTQHEGLELRLVSDGVLADCDSAVFMDLLQKELYPSGLTQRLSRLVDDQEDVGCTSTKGSWSHIMNL